MNVNIIIQSEGIVEDINRWLGFLQRRDKHQSTEQVVASIIKIACYGNINSINEEITMLISEINTWFSTSRFRKEAMTHLIPLINKMVKRLREKFVLFRIVDDDGVCPYRFFGWADNHSFDMILFIPNPSFTE